MINMEARQEMSCPLHQSKPNYTCYSKHLTRNIYNYVTTFVNDVLNTDEE